MITGVIGAVFGHTSGWDLFVRVVTIISVLSIIVRLVPVWRRRGGRRRQPRPYRQALGIAGLCVAVGAAACGSVYALGRHPHTAARSHASHVRAAAVPVATVPIDHYLGVFEPGEIGDYGRVEQFGEAAGRQPNLVLYYSNLFTPFQTAFAETAHQHGATPFVQLNSGSASMASVAGGRYDNQLRAFASQVRSYGHPVVMSFAAEPNGGWYTWGVAHTPPAQWIAAWRHVVTIFRRAGAGNVTWLWTVNSIDTAPSPVRQWWPGSAYVDWVGIDGYYFTSADTFSTVFGTTIARIRQFTKAPILISETATGPGPEQASQIGDLFAGVRTDHLAGLVWFDMAQHDGLYHQDWRLEDTPVAVAAFRQAARS